MKKIFVLMAAMSLLCAQAQAQSFLDKLKQKAEEAAAGAILGEKAQSVLPESARSIAQMSVSF